MQTSSATPIQALQEPNQELAAILKAAADPLRLDILRLLAKDSLAVLELAAVFDIRQSGISHHLKVLAKAGLVATRREGNSIFYRRALADQSNPHSALMLALYEEIDRHPLADVLRAALKSVQAERSRISEAFFCNNADKFRAVQDLIASYPVYADAVAEMLQKTPLAARHHALELGPGEGEFLPQLARGFSQVFAVDISATLLQQAQRHCEKHSAENVEFVHGDATAAADQGIQADCIVVNMVLHHTASPATLFEQLSSLLKPSGALIITDLCHHDQQWALESCGDLWLGFEPNDLSRWASSAGLREGASQYMALRNGFQIQIRQFFRPSFVSSGLSNHRS